MSRIKTETGWAQNDIATDLVTQVGYYLMLADDLAAGIKISKSNPEFACVPSAKIEIRPIKSKEIKTGYTYPNSQIN
ncbi:MAG: hypothetical protein IPO85_08075 [Saprospiraceae bacterium]|uniref:Uncharacterized protein n=1 Tax=Candidatus Defluviibacterium haderslevense TaxID=2981993 RepID=A0A9D7S978_9BACT|nr:hypothetical protein [Candidatus Defluviibacterium haderslevense]